MARNRDRIEPTFADPASDALRIAELDCPPPPRIVYRDRPFLISAFSALMLVSGLLGLGLLGLKFAGYFGPVLELGPLDTLVWVNLLVVSTVSLVVSVFVWDGYKIGWMALIFGLFLGLLLALQGIAFGVLTDPGASASGFGLPILGRYGLKLLLHVAALAYVFSKPVRAFFQLSWREAILLAAIALIPIIGLGWWGAHLMQSAS